METQNNPIVYTHHRQPPSPAITSTLNNDSHEPQQYFINTEPMFQKILTPSDVGKLNRLVIPKQHAELYFPIGGGGDTAHHRKGLLLSFEDESAKLWRFRYSYWNSSQSYVLTKGWSRYVKEKRLDAGDLVLFERDRLDCERMFIGWRRRSAAVNFGDGVEAVARPGNGGGSRVSRRSIMAFHDSQSNNPSHRLTPYQSDCLHADAGDVYEHVDNYPRRVVATRQLRLFGVNLECPDDSEPPTPDSLNQSDYQYGYSFMDTRHD